MKPLPDLAPQPLAPLPPSRRVRRQRSSRRNDRWAVIWTMTGAVGALRNPSYDTTSVVDRTSGSGTQTAPAGAVSVVVETQAVGEAGGTADFTQGGGGGGRGGYCSDNARTVAPNDTCAYNVTAGTVDTGTGGFSGIAHFAQAGTPGTDGESGGAGGPGGAASGGTAANTAGGDGTPSSGGPGGAGATSGGGPIAGYGDGGNGGSAAFGAGSPGEGGLIRFTFTIRNAIGSPRHVMQAVGRASRW